MKVISVLLVFSASVLAGATADPTELTQLIDPLAAISNAMSWIGIAPDSAVVRRSLQGQLQGQEEADLGNCPTANKEYFKACASKVNETYNNTNFQDSPCDAVKPLEAVAVCLLSVKECIIFSAKNTSDVAAVCAQSSNKRNSLIDALMDQARIKCPGVEMYHLSLWTKFAWENICSSGGISTVVIVLIVVAVVVVLCIAYYVLNSLEKNATAATKTAATKTEAGRVADVPLAVPFAGAA
jgi:hypothetical protein